MKIFSFVGWSQSGKTGLISRLIQEMKRRGKRVAAVKSVHGAYHLQPEGKDTERFLRAGADDVFLVSGYEMLRMKSFPSQPEMLAELGRMWEENDFVFLEGIAPEGVPMLEVYDPEHHPQLKFSPENLAAVISGQKLEMAVPCMREDDMEGIIRFMEAYHE